MFYSYISTLLSAFDIFSRAGGGGSSGGGGGGGSSSGGSSGGSGGLIVVIGYIPMHFIGRGLQKKLSTAISSIIGWIIAVIYAIILILLLRSFLGFFAGGAAIFGMGAGLYGWFDKIGKMAKMAKNKQALAAQKDGSWNIDTLKAITSSIFVKYQKDWGDYNLESMKLYLTPKYWQHNQFMVMALQQLNRQNLMSNVQILSLDLIDINDNEDNNKDSFIMKIEARAQDDLIDKTTNTRLFQDNKSFIEYWKFIRKDNNWFLDGIIQDTQDIGQKNNVLELFAQKNNCFFSLDWGWLLLPCRGQLFGEGSFGVSDINNHVIGVYNNILIQLYNYVPRPANEGNSKNYIIAQVALPKTYGNIVVRKKSLINFGIKDLTKVTMEWGEFNKKYEVYASDMERVTSFELLNPGFMVKLQEMPFEVNIEVVDNIVYLYSNKTVPSEQNYERMLYILQQAFKEMRM